MTGSNPGDRKVAIVTGGSQGLGYAAVSALARRGYVVGAMSRDAQVLESAVARLEPGLRENVVALPGDVRNERDVVARVEEVVERFGRLDVLLNCAGTSLNARRRLVDTSSEDWARLIDSNLTGTYLMCRAALPHLEASGNGYLVNVLSTAALVAKPGVSLYAASKFGARALTESLIEEYRGSTVRISSVSPGPIETSIWEHKLEPPTKEARARMLRPDDVAEIFVWLIERPPLMHIGNILVTPWVSA